MPSGRSEIAKAAAADEVDAARDGRRSTRRAGKPIAGGDGERRRGPHRRRSTTPDGGEPRTSATKRAKTQRDAGAGRRPGFRNVRSANFGGSAGPRGYPDAAGRRRGRTEHRAGRHHRQAQIDEARQRAARKRTPTQREQKEPAADAGGAAAGAGRHPVRVQEAGLRRARARPSAKTSWWVTMLDGVPARRHFGGGSYWGQWQPQPELERRHIRLGWRGRPTQ
jgi:hypothetical protein